MSWGPPYADSNDGGSAADCSRSRILALTLNELNPGSRLGPYEILASIGAGGMGVVYRARDPRIGRDVAVKVLPPGFASDDQRLRRFEIEARSAGMLHHPNLLTVFDVGVDDGTPYIVSELLDGETLRSKIVAGQIPLRKTIDYAKQTAFGLAAAHEKGIVHRDLKPDNIFVTRDGHVKILDFGLAKLSAPLRDSDTTVPRPTEPGTVLGTVGYMSPEQVRGEDVDHRSDIFAFGSILYEMVTGRRAFAGPSAADTMSAILREDPPEITNPNAAPAIDRIIHHCLEKDAAERFQSARDLAFDLDSLSVGSVAPLPAAKRSGGIARWLVPIAALGAGVLAGIALQRSRTRPVAPPTLRELTYSGQDTFPAVSPDGRSIVFASTRDGRSRIWLKDLANGGEIPLTQGEDRFPRYSHDGASILFVHDEGPTRASVWRTAVVGGTPRKLIADADSADWSGDDRRIIFTRHAPETPQLTALCTAAANDGSGEVRLANLNRRYTFPRYSPDGRWVALTDVSGGNNNSIVFLISADGKTQRPRTGSKSTFAGLSTTSWLDDRHLLYGASQSSVTFTNLGRIMMLETDAMSSEPLLEMLSTIVSVEAAGEGRVIFGTVYQRQSLREIPVKEPGEHAVWRTRGNGIDRQPAYSPDGSRIVFSSNRSGNLDLWIVATKDGSLARLTDDAADDYDPAFTPDGNHVIWSSNRNGHYEIWMADADGSGARQISNDGNDAENPTATRDGWIIYNSYNPQRLGIWKIRNDGSSATHVVKAATEIPEVSPDGAYVSFARLPPANDIDVVRLSDGKILSLAKLHGQTYQIGAGRSRWTPDGKSLAWIDLNDQNDWTVFVQPFEFGAPGAATAHALVPDADLHVESFGFSPDGRSAVISVLEETDTIYSADGLRSIHRPKR